MSGKGMLLRVFGMGIGIAAAASSASADVHTWRIVEVFTNPSGSTQFIELLNDLNGEPNFKTFNNVHLISDNEGATQQQTFIFPNDLSSNATAGKKLLIGTGNLGSLPGGVTPDFVIPSSFIYDGGRLRLVGTTGIWGTFEDMSYTAAQLPNDGFLAMTVDHANRGTATNSPTNFAGATGSVPEPATAGLFGLAGAFALLRRRSK